MGRGTRAEKGREGARTCQDHKDSRDGSRRGVGFRAARIHPCWALGQGAGVGGIRARSAAHRETRASPWFPTPAAPLVVAPPGCVCPRAPFTWRPPSHLSEIFYGNSDDVEQTLDILQGVQREVGGAAARSYGSFFLPHCDHLGIPLPSSITPGGEVGVHDGQAGEGRLHARGRGGGGGVRASAVTVVAQQCRALSTTTVRGSARGTGCAKDSARGRARPHHGPREPLGCSEGRGARGWIGVSPVRSRGFYDVRDVSR